MKKIGPLFGPQFGPLNEEIRSTIRSTIRSNIVKKSVHPFGSRNLVPEFGPTVGLPNDAYLMSYHVFQALLGLAEDPVGQPELN